ncbi:MAG: AbrB/MazE/SpoVT family DNA-binding domain-containing protein [Bacillota bacterium]
MYRVTVSSKGQVVIPIELRKSLSLSQGTHLRVYERDGRIVLVPEISDPVDHGLGFLRRTRHEIREDLDGIG